MEDSSDVDRKPRWEAEHPVVAHRGVPSDLGELTFKHRHTPRVSGLGV